MSEAPSREPLHEVVIRAFEESGALERVLARLPGFQVPLLFQFRSVGAQILVRWGVGACAHILISTRWRQAAFLLALIAAGGLATGKFPLQLVGVALDMVALGCVLQAARRRNTSGIPVARRSKVGSGRAPILPDQSTHARGGGGPIA
ncbi:MAG: hypothetical protein M0Z54_10835 [Thermaerobacter sp.]|nr:hypothetical protein [Thermaerobacter sp.]